MKVKKATIKALIAEMRGKGQSKQEIEDAYKAALKQKMIDVDDWSYAIEVLYG